MTELMPENRRLKRISSAALFIMTLSLVFETIARAQVIPEDTVASSPAVEEQAISLWSTLQAGGVIGYLLGLTSLVAVSLVIEHLISIRRVKFIPPDLTSRLAPLLDAQEFDQAQSLAENDKTFLGEIIAAGLARRGSMFGFYDMNNAMQEVSERQVSLLYRKLEYLSFIASTAPMLGLLGTVTGMISAFNTIAQTHGAATPEQLAGGISEALITTCMGLVVAIPAMFFLSFFRNRIDSCIAEAEPIVEKLMGRFRVPGQGDTP